MKQERIHTMKSINDKRFLSHLKNCVPNSAHNYMLSTYTIILEAWRRGLDIDIKILKQKTGKIAPYYTIRNGAKSHNFSVTRGDLVSKKAVNIANNKHLTKEYLTEANVETPKGSLFTDKHEDEDVLNYARETGYPLVLKPIDGTGGKGVVANIQNDEEMKHALTYVREQLNYKKVIVEDYFQGEDHRLYVVDDKVIGVFKRDPASVTGNGKDTIEILLKRKNIERSKIPSVKDTPIKVDSETKELLRRLDYTLKSVPEDGEVVFLKSKSNVSSGGEAVDVTDETTDEMKQIAVNAVKSIPTLVQGGVDMMIDKKKNKGVVLEINSRAHIRTHLFPSYGKARDIPTAIIDYYFPETKDYDREEPNKLYIDYDFIYNACLSRDAASIKIPKISAASIVLKRYSIAGLDYTNSIGKKVRRLAFNNKLNGFIKPLKNNNITVVVGGNAKNIDEFYKQLKRHIYRSSKNSVLTEKKRTTPIPHGFSIIDSKIVETSNEITNETYHEKYSNLRNDYEKLVGQLAKYEHIESVLELTEKQNKELKKQLNHVEKSTSWALTKPIRLAGKLKRKKP